MALLAGQDAGKEEGYVGLKWPKQILDLFQLGRGQEESDAVTWLQEESNLEFIEDLVMLSFVLKGSQEGEKYLPFWPKMRVKKEKAK